MTDLNYRSLMKHDFDEQSPDAWSRIYREILPKLNFAAALVRAELDAFASTSGKDRLALTEIRVKSEKSFLEKIRNISSDRERLTKKFHSSPCSIFQLVTDLVGGRLVFYFERDLREALLFWLGYPPYLPVNVEHWTQSVSGFDNELSSASWLRFIPSTEPSQKASGYESLHLVMQCVPELIATRYGTWKHKGEQSSAHRFDWASLRQMNDGDEQRLTDRIGDLEGVMFEIQCRTTLEHTWAEVEHRLSYGPGKSLNDYSLGDSDGQAQAFRIYKSILRSAQMHQNSLRSGFGRWDSDEDAMVSRSSAVNIGPRAQFWDNDGKRAAESAAAAIHAALKESNGEGQPHSMAGWDKAMDTIEKHLKGLAPAGRSKEGRELLRIHPGLAPDEYGRRRLWVMLLGFVLGHAWRPGERSDEGDANNPRQRAARAYMRANLPDTCLQWIPPRLVALRLYEHLRILDESFSFRGDRADVFRDPLVLTRAASVHYRHFGKFRRASQLLQESLEQLDKGWSEGIDPPPPLLTKCHVGLHLAESHWVAYQLEGRQEEDLGLGLQAAKAALDSLGPRSSSEPDWQSIRRQKLRALTLTMRLFEASANLGEKRLRGGETGWQLLKQLREGVETLDREDESAGIHEDLPDSSLRLQGIAVAFAVRAAAVDDRRKRDINLTNARRHIRRARRRIEARASRQRGGALPFHVDSCREIEGFIYSLCSDDSPIPAQNKKRARRS